MHFSKFGLVLTVSVLLAAGLSAQTPGSGQGWMFAVSGDSRNSGDVVMPAIAASVRTEGDSFYWHLGDFRAIYTFDQDYQQLHKGGINITSYLGSAWQDFIDNQLSSFGEVPVYLGVGNHELIPPKTREQLINQFADWLNAPAIRTQRLVDDPHDHAVRTYYHFIQDGIDFVTLDNGTADQFDDAQLRWLQTRIAFAKTHPEIRAIVVGMHEALPDSISDDHSMSQSAVGVATGRQVYQWLVDLHKAKPVYILASHSHFYMEGIFNTAYVKANGGVLPGWIVGTAGAVRYALPPNKGDAIDAREHIYGFMTGHVTADPANPIQFTYKQLNESDVPADVVAKFSAAFVHDCWENNPVPKH